MTTYTTTAATAVGTYAPPAPVAAAPTRREELPALTGLRFVAVFYIVVFHSLSSYLGHLPAVGVNFVRGAAVFVGVFFVLSGFVLTYTYQESIRTDRRSFFFARFARIYPLYFLSLVVALPLFVRSLRALAPAAIVSHVGGMAIWDLSLTQAWSVRAACEWNCPTWTISAEVFYYALFPLLIAALAPRSTRALVGAVAAALVGSAAVVTVVARLVVSHLDAATVSPAAMVLYFPPTHLAEFIAGMAGAFWFTRRRRGGGGGWLTTVAFAVIGAALLSGAHRDHVANAYLELALVPACVALIVGLARGGGPIGRLLATRPMELLGRASFGLYVFHLPLLDYARLAYDPDRGRAAGTGAGRLLAWMVGCWIVAVLLSVATHYWVEEPARHAIRRLGRRRTGRVAIAPGVSA